MYAEESIFGVFGSIQLVLGFFWIIVLTIKSIKNTPLYFRLSLPAKNRQTIAQILIHIYAFLKLATTRRLPAYHIECVIDTSS